MRHALLFLLIMPGCACDEEAPEPSPEGLSYPRLLVRADMKATLLARQNLPVFSDLYSQIEAKADGEYRIPDGEGWDYHAYNHNACIAQASAFLAWLHEDQARADKAREHFKMLETDMETHGDWDLNIRMPANMVCGVQAWDLLMGTDFFPEAEAAEAQEKLGIIADKFYAQYVETELYRWSALVVTQNNHPIRTAACLILPGLAFPDHPEAKKWLDWGLAEYDYLFAPEGQYIQAEGGVSEGSFYFHFGLAAAMGALIAADNAGASEGTYHRNCISRNPAEPWNGGPCEDGGAFTFRNALYSEHFGRALDWSVALRMGDGRRPSIADGGLNNPNGSALIAHWQPDKMHQVWDWQNQTSGRVRGTGWGLDLLIQHYAYLPEPVGGEAPAWKHRVMPESGYAIFRSGWEEDQRYSVLLAERGAARLTLHDHVDGTHFLLSAYGEYLAIDTGYYKPNTLDNAITAEAQAHNVILIEGRGDATKGMLNDWTGNDAYLEHSAENDHLVYAEARTNYRQSEITRGMAMLRDRYWVVADRIVTEAPEAREHRWRFHAGAGYDLGGEFHLNGDRLEVVQAQARLDLALASTAGTPVFEAPPFEEHEAPYVHSIGGGEAHHGVADGIVTAQAPFYLAIMVPSPTETEPDFSIRALPAPRDSVAYRIEGPDGVDVVWLRGPEAAETMEWEDHSLQSDGTLTILAMDGSFGLMARGTEVRLDGALQLSGPGDEGVSILP